jgi:transcriptional regulator with XRE-family HTH domain
MGGTRKNNFRNPTAAELALGEMTNEEFREAMSLLGMSLDGMAHRLGLSRRIIASYRKDETLPPAVAMATKQLLNLRRETEGLLGQRSSS